MKPALRKLVQFLGLAVFALARARAIVAANPRAAASTGCGSRPDARP